MTRKYFSKYSSDKVGINLHSDKINNPQIQQETSRVIFKNWKDNSGNFTSRNFRIA